MKSREFIPEMQIARGLGIVLVSAGHSEPIRDVFPEWFSLIYSFHMPLFFFLSGFFSTRLAAVTSLREWGRETPRRMLRLVVPYFVISFSYALLKSFVPHLAKRPVILAELLPDILLYPTRNPALFLWFLYTLIIIRLLLPILSRVDKYLLLALLLPFQFYLLDTEILGIGLISFYLIYYMLGLYMASIRERFFSCLKGRWGVPIALSAFTAGYTLLRFADLSLLKFPVALAGIAVVLCVSFNFNRYLPTTTLQVLGQSSLEIYLLQYYFIFPICFLLYRAGLPGEWIVPFTFLAALGGPLAVTNLIFPHNRPLAFLLGGRGPSGTVA
ncbi:MAG TPA: acyltransferase family protein [Thermodesulfobacteriota bacterium]|jgi:fucose 4-O-acetylase-like acetyltransferase|nr:acyltransferase family protein [Thermodesulfobacteriota bacterium]